MSEHENKRDSETADRVFQLTNHGLGDDLTRVANDERITEPNIEDYLRGEARVAASKNRGQRSLLHSEGGAVLDILARMLRGARHKTFVASAQLTPGFGGGVGPCRWLLAHGWGSFTLPWCGNCFGAWGLVPLFWGCYCFWMAGPMAVAISWNSGSVAVPRRTNVVVPRVVASANRALPTSRLELRLLYTFHVTSLIVAVSLGVVCATRVASQVGVAWAPW